MPCIRQCKVIFLSPFPPWKVHLFCRLCTDRYLVIDECRHICQRDDIPLRRRKKKAWPRYPWWHAGNRNLEILSACYVNHRNRDILFAMQICSQGQEHVFWDFFSLKTPVEYLSKNLRTSLLWKPWPSNQVTRSGEYFFIGFFSRPYKFGQKIISRALENKFSLALQMWFVELSIQNFEQKQLLKPQTRCEVTGHLHHIRTMAEFAFTT